MPHFHIEYSANLETVVDMSAFCEAIRTTAASIETFPMPGIRVRAVRVDHVAMADGNAKHGFIDLIIRLREGRSDAVKQDALSLIFETMKQFLDAAMQTNSVALSAEIVDISDGFSAKTGTVRNHLE